jgi:hypothetical protein
MTKVFRRVRGSRLWQEAKRLRWAIAISVLTVAALDGIQVVSPLSKYAISLYALGKTTIFVIVFHLVRTELFPYIDLSEALQSGDVGRAIGTALTVLGVAIIFAAGLLAL